MIEQKKVGSDENNIRLDRWFKLHYPSISFVSLQKLLRSGQVRIDGKRAKASVRVQTDNLIRVPPLAEKSPSVTLKTMRNKNDKDILDSMLLFETKDIFVFNKPCGLAVQGGSGINKNVDDMLESLRSKKGVKPRLVHRLDRNTSGLLVVAKTRNAAVELTTSFRKRSVKKIYWALVAGILPKTSGRLSCYLQKIKVDGVDKMQVAKHGQKNSVHAISTYKIIEKSGRKIAWVELQPETGRTHQLRVQMDNLGNPILGDDKYFSLENWQIPNGIQNKLHLHARQIILPPPLELNITAPLPPHMVQSWNLFNFEENHE